MLAMTEAMQTIKGKIVLLAELFQPAVRGLVVHGFAVPLDKEPVCLHPLVTAFESLHILFVLVHQYLSAFAHACS